MPNIRKLWFPSVERFELLLILIGGWYYTSGHLLFSLLEKPQQIRSLKNPSQSDRSKNPAGPIVESTSQSDRSKAQANTIKKKKRFSRFFVCLLLYWYRFFTFFCRFCWRTGCSNTILTKGEILVGLVSSPPLVSDLISGTMVLTYSSVVIGLYGLYGPQNTSHLSYCSSATIW